MKITTPHYSKVFGTPTDRLAEQLSNAHIALEALKDSMREIEFNARDYSDEQWREAVAEREQVRKALTLVENYLLDHLEAVLA